MISRRKVLYALGSIPMAGAYAVGIEPRWLNALTSEPFPSGWSVRKWRQIASEHPPSSVEGAFRETA